MGPEVTRPQRWQADKAEASRRKARPGLCGRCGAAVLAGPDSDMAAIPAVVDAAPVGRDARPGDYAMFRGELHRLDATRPDRQVWARHDCPEA